MFSVITNIHFQVDSLQIIRNVWNVDYQNTNFKFLGVILIAFPIYFIIIILHGVLSSPMCCPEFS